MEYLIQDKLEAEGYFVVRAAGSHGVADLVAIRQRENDFFQVPGYPNNDRPTFIDIVFVSCKIPMYAPPAERKALMEAAERCGAKAVMTVKDKAGRWVLQRVDS